MMTTPPTIYTMPGKPEPPEHLTDAGKSRWREILAEYSIDVAALPMLTIYLTALDRVEAARLVIAEKGAVINDRFGVPKKNPWVDIERDQALIAQRAFRVLGFDQEPRGGSQGKLPFG